MFKKQITKKAEARYEKEYLELLRFCNNNIIMQQLRLNLEEANKNNKTIGITGTYGDNGSYLFGLQGGGRITNEAQIRKNLIERFKEEEFSNIVNKLETIRYLFESG